jgi:hypothetical protein
MRKLRLRLRLVIVLSIHKCLEFLRKLRLTFCLVIVLATFRGHRHGGDLVH